MPKEGAQNVPQFDSYYDKKHVKDKPIPPETPQQTIDRLTAENEELRRKLAAALREREVHNLPGDRNPEGPHFAAGDLHPAEGPGPAKTATPMTKIERLQADLDAANASGNKAAIKTAQAALDKEKS
jgi:hypothetical protein